MGGFGRFPAGHSEARIRSEPTRENPMVALLLAAPAALLPALILLGRYERRTLESAYGDQAAMPMQDVQPTIRVVSTQVD